ncbi:MAG: SLC13 family permease [Reyranellaceae bacterium]
MHPASGPNYLNYDLLIVVGLLLAAILMFIRNRPRMDVVALIMMTALPLTGVISVQEALAGLADPNIVLIAALFVVGESLVRTGVAQRLGDWLLKRAGHSEAGLIPRLMVIVAGVGSFMSSTAVVALFIPVVLRIVRTTGISPGRLMMPLSVAALISGMMTLVATAPNLVVHGELVRNGLEGFDFFTFTPFGLPLLALAVLYMLVARRFLSSARSTGSAGQARPRLAQWIEDYGLTGREHRLRVSSRSSLAGRTLNELDLRGSAGVNIVAVERPGRLSSRIILPTPTTNLRAGDILFLDLSSPTVDIDEACSRFDLEPLPLAGDYFVDRRQDIGMVEVMVTPGSRLIDKTVVESRFRSEFDLNVLGLRRGSEPGRGNVLDEKLRLGDTLLLMGPWRAIRRLQDRKDLFVLNLPAEIDDVAPVASRAPHALATLALVVALMVSGIVPNVVAALAGCLLLGLLRCIDAGSAYRSIQWHTLILIVGMMPFAVALQKTGGIELAASALIATLGDAGIHAMLAALFIVTAMLSLFISNTATAILMAPVAIAAARDLGVSPYPFAMVVALAASAAFMTPVASPVNALVVGPGNYRFADFVRVGVPLAALSMVVTVFLAPLLLPP